MPNSSPSINLIKNKGIPLFDNFMNWALTIGRLIVILTEVVAVAAFIYRFSLDEKLIDLHSAIKQKQNIIAALKNDEDKYRNLQDRIAIASTFSEKTVKFNQTVEDIVSLMPNQLKIKNLILDKNKVSINIDTASMSFLASFINSLKSYPGTKSINIENIENKPSVGLSVSITVLLK